MVVKFEIKTLFQMQKILTQRIMFSGDKLPADDRLFSFSGHLPKQKTEGGSPDVDNVKNTGASGRLKEFIINNRPRLLSKNE